jgi:hypothetical protein
MGLFLLMRNSKASNPNYKQTDTQKNAYTISNVWIAHSDAYGKQSKACKI